MDDRTPDDDLRQDFWLIKELAHAGVTAVSLHDRKTIERLLTTISDNLVSMTGILHESDA